MKTSSDFIRFSVIFFKFISILIGLLFISISLVILFESIVHYRNPLDLNFNGSVEMLSAVGALISGITLVSIFPESMRAKFTRPSSKAPANPTYGFVTLLSVGIGATIGSPLFIILPVNIIQYAMVSLISLTIAGTLSYLIARIYSYMFVYTRANKLDAVGGPGFVKITTRDRSVRYFIARFSMWIANTALAAFSAIFLFTFTFQDFPEILSVYGINGSSVYFFEGTVLLLFIIWFIVNAFFERKYLKTIGYAQIVLLGIIILLIIVQGLFLGFAGSWNFSGFLSYRGSNIWLDVIENTGYLFILFFGFQEIQSLGRESLETSSIPLISRMFKLRPIPKEKYFPMAMMLTVLISLILMIFDALTIYAVHPSLGALQSSNIPALYIVKYYISPRFQIVTMTAFLLATVTTFVPAFIAASRHLRALSEDGFFPRSVKSFSWIFTVMLIILLSLTNPGFLVNITDFMVLIALGIICLSAFWLRKVTGKVPRSIVATSLIAGIGAFIIDISVYPVSQLVVLLGVVAVILSFLMYDAISLGTVGLQLFVIFFDLLGFLFLSYFPSDIAFRYPAIFGPLSHRIIFPDTDLREIILFSAITIFINVLMDVFVIKRTDYFITKK